ncbi:hypothetical protein VO54_00577 [Elizabethkingia miricola]|nr:hypothetical protein VO54_00577 [Elizabethkingia miricola]
MVGRKYIYNSQKRDIVLLNIKEKINKKTNILAQS